VLATAIREVQEETGLEISKDGNLVELGSIKQKGGKVVHAWALEYSGPTPATCQSNVFHMEWPIGSGQLKGFPEVDRAEFFPLEMAKMKIKPTQIPLLERLAAFSGTKVAVHGSHKRREP
jgi:predicted NUDIX family NTP pyrophosphohydrolase